MPSTPPLPSPPSERFNFAVHLLARNAHRGSKAAYVDDVRTLSYAGLQREIEQFASALMSIGVRREERVLLCMQDCADWPVAFLGALYAGVVPVAVNTLLPAADIAYMLAHSRAQAVFTSAALLPTIEAAIAQLEASEVRRLVVSQLPADGSPATAVDRIGFVQFLALSQGSTQPAPTAADDIAFWLYSSGSTGKPKGTVHSHANAYWTAELYAAPVLGLREDDVLFSAAKLFFAYGLGNALSFPLSVGATTLLMAERPTPDACFKRFVQHKPTVFFGAPTGYAGMLASPALPARAELALRLCSSAGEALPREIGERWARHVGCDVVDGIGSTEMLHVYLSNRPDDVRYGSSGKPVPGYELEIRDESGEVITAANEQGELFIKGPSSALMYWSDRAKSRATFHGAWTKSGDKYFRDDEGYYVYAGRSDDMLKVSGQYVSPFEVESTLMQHPAVLESAVIGVEDEHKLTRVKAYVVLKTPGDASAALGDELCQFVKAKLAPHKYPRALEFVAELPKTATGKIQRFRLRQREQELR